MVTEETWCRHFFELLKTITAVIFCGDETPADNLCTIADIVLFCGTAIDVRSLFFFPRNIPFQFGLCS